MLEEGQCREVPPNLSGEPPFTNHMLRAPVEGGSQAPPQVGSRSEESIYVRLVTMSLGLSLTILQINDCLQMAKGKM